LLGVLVCAPAARAQLVVAGDNQIAIPIEPSWAGPGLSLGLRASLWLQAEVELWGIEVGGTWAHLPMGDESVHAVDAALLWRGELGARVEFGKRVRPGIFAHVGYLTLEGESVRVDAQSSFERALSGFVVDAGIYLDVLLWDRLLVGPQVSYNYLVGEDELSWVSAGLHLGVKVWP
jgi:hypothetical protein